MLKKILFFCLISIGCNAFDYGRDSYADIVAPLIPAVVNISIMQKPATSGSFLQDNPQFEEFRKFFEHFGQMPNMEEEERSDALKPASAGSGFIISPEGYIVTD